ncbi:O-antigen/teichoic acid export membrane protein [Pseudonocardia hierapolitana]|uniref:O-antigen/teichoic acid export membrane protein n=2 Tax=Pseudonocardia hierapolitana TaxID=1128676 RepID=A0A561SZ21_9PSEU|nr:O-antigen/teichoic acid export membrane protein [Pseudonocardia hierapolitana]
MATTPLRVAGSSWPHRGDFAIAELPTQPVVVTLPPTTDGATKSTGRGGGGAAMSISSAIGALAGLASWLIAARLLPQAEVGLAAAVVSAFILIAGITQLNLGLGLMRWLPVAGCHAPPLVWRSLLLIMPLAGLVGLGYVLAVPELARTAAGADGPHSLGVCLFALAAAGWGAFVVHDYILMAIGKPWWCVWRNGLFAVVRITLLVALGTALGAQGVVLSWVGPIVVWITVGSLVLLVAVRRFARRACGGILPGRSEIVGFLGPTAAAQMGYTLLLNQVPLVVILRFGPEAGAAFFIAWQATVVLETTATYYTHSLSAAWARAPERAAELTSSSRKRLLVIFLPLLAVGALLAGPGLSIFGANYAPAADVLRLLLLGQAFRLIVVHELGVRTAAGRSMAYARLHLASTLLVLATVALVPAADVGPGGAGVVLLPVAVGYAAVQLVVAAHVVVVGLRGLRRARVRHH